MISIPEQIPLPQRFIQKLKHDMDIVNSYRIDDILFVILFGSCAKGNMTAASDLDLMFVTESKLDFHLAKEITERLDDPVDEVSTDSVFYTLDELKNGQSRFTKEVLAHGKILWKKQKLF